MRFRLPKISEPPILWSIPFTLLLLTTLAALMDWLVPFITLNVGHETWVWIAATLVTSMVTSVITEIASSDKRRVLISMLASTTIFSVLYNDIVNVFLAGFMETVQGSMPHPILGSAINTLVLSLVPGSIVGLLIGAAISLIPKAPTLEKNKLAMTTPTFYQPLSTFEKVCGRCGRIAPYESLYCPICGSELTKREAPATKFCMYCGSKINYLGKFCPECGEEIDQTTKTWTYRANH